MHVGVLFLYQIALYRYVDVFFCEFSENFHNSFFADISGQLLLNTDEIFTRFLKLYQAAKIFLKHLYANSLQLY